MGCTSPANQHFSFTINLKTTQVHGSPYLTSLPWFQLRAAQPSLTDLPDLGGSAVDNARGKVQNVVIDSSANHPFAHVGRSENEDRLRSRKT